MTKPDDLEAVRNIVATLEQFENQDRERILRWVKEKLGMKDQTLQSLVTQPQHEVATEQQTHKIPIGVQDIKTFINGKSPKNDNEFITAVAYFYRFIASEEEKKENIGTPEVVDACRKVPWKQPTRPNQALINTEKAGYLDKVSSGIYKINSVGENLIAMVLTGQLERPKKSLKRTKKNVKSTKRNR